MMITQMPTPEGMHRFTDTEGSSAQRQDPEPIKEPVLADAEEEEMAELWAADPGNQGA